MNSVIIDQADNCEVVYEVKGELRTVSNTAVAITPEWIHMKDVDTFIPRERVTEVRANVYDVDPEEVR